ncbi:hypothetical protein TMCBR2_gp055 [Caulobacter phage TMCBR2]|uniref:Uncharacterized protein n=1 Tax=Caulobacter phage TMCBR2 TaxID=3025404 RepID=A0AAF0BYM1_9CAUD|nr:hypothetical protein TMCBR2_gp055 [Caulobacter phage TMCBR2]WDS38305.1 hypothetical protein TMCBR3_gp057 [Caulobacter phage TMCBR3]
MTRKVEVQIAAPWRFLFVRMLGKDRAWGVALNWGHWMVGVEAYRDGLMSAAFGPIILLTAKVQDL